MLYAITPLSLPFVLFVKQKTSRSNACKKLLHQRCQNEKKNKAQQEL